MVDAAHLDWIFNGPVGITICFVGLIGNVISIYAWYRIMKKARSGGTATGIYLITLGIVDSGLLFFFLICCSLPATSKTVEDTYAYAFLFSYFGFPIFSFFIIASIWIMVGVTVTSLIMLRFPFKAKTWCSTKCAYIGIAATLIFVFFINIPYFFNYRPMKVKDGYTSYPTEYGSSEAALMYEFWVYCMFMVLVPWATIAVLNAIIIYSMLSRTKYMQGLDKTASSKLEPNKQDRQMTRVILTVTFTCLFLRALQCITQCFFMLRIINREICWDQNVSLAFTFARMDFVINSAINCFLYCFTGSVFRAEVKKMFGFSSKSKYTAYTSTSRGQRADTTETFTESKA